MDSLSYDLIIKNGFIIDGTGNPGFKGDLAIKGSKIVDIRSIIDAEAKEIIDASGKTVAPGFIDPHVHEELIALENGKFEVFLKQGVTTIINGNCGHSVISCNSEKIFEYMHRNGLLSSEEYYGENKWDNLREYIDLVKQKGSNINLGILLGHGTIRWLVMGGSKDRKPNKKEEQEIFELIRLGLEEGALGLSTGLDYIPSCYADTEELIGVASILSKYDGIYTSHLRNYIGEMEAVKEAIEIGKKTGVRVQISHLSPKVPEAFDEILKARNDGVEIAVDTIPKSSGHCIRKDRVIQSIKSSSRELFDKNIKEAIQFMKDPKNQEKIAQEARIFSEDGASIFFINTKTPDLEGLSLKELAIRKKKEQKKLLFEMLCEENLEFTLWLGGERKEGFPGEEYPDNVSSNPLVMVGSDRIFGEMDDPYVWYELFRTGAFPIFFKLMRQKGVRVEEIIRRITSLPAQQFRLLNRGILREGMAADVVTLDLNRYNFPDNRGKNYHVPIVFAEGIDYVIVNGNVVMEKGKVKEIKAGKFLGKYSKEL